MLCSILQYDYPFFLSNERFRQFIIEPDSWNYSGDSFLCYSNSNMHSGIDSFMRDKEGRALIGSSSSEE